jgi:hypothetical protein
MPRPSAEFVAVFLFGFAWGLFFGVIGLVWWIR